MIRRLKGSIVIEVVFAVLGGIRCSVFGLRDALICQFAYSLIQHSSFDIRNSSFDTRYS